MPAETHPRPALRRELRLRDLVLFSLAGIIGTRWLAAAARTGPGSLSLWVLAIIFFLIPSAICIARLSARYPDEGGLYVWSRENFGPWHGFLCFWLYWIGLAFWFPSFLMAITSMSSFAFAPQWAGNRAFIVPASLALLWLAMGANLAGLKFGKWVDNCGALASYALCALLLGLAAVAYLHHGSATPLHVWPQWNWGRLNFWSQIAYALTGLELAPVLGGEIVRPERNLPLSSLIAAPIAGFWYLAGTLALLVVLAPGQISPLNGITQVVAAAGGRMGAAWLTIPAVGLILVAAVGQLCVLGGVGARLPFVVGADRYLPPWLAKVHRRRGTPAAAIWFFGILASIILVAAQWGQSAFAAYQTITDVMVIAGFVPFVYIFLAARKCGARLSAACGLGVTAVALATSVIPAAGMRPWLFEAELIGATAGLIVAGRILFRYYRRREAQPAQAYGEG